MSAEANALETLVAERRRLLLWYMPGTALFLGSMALHYAFPQWADSGPMIALSLIGGLAFAISMMHLTVFILKTVFRKDTVARALNDERVEQARLLAWRDAFFAVVASQSVWLGVLAFPSQRVPASVVVVVTIAIACLVSAGSFLWRDRE